MVGAVSAREEPAIACGRCNGERWVCENHKDRPWPSVCDCGAGAPCPDCNPGALDEADQALRDALVHGILPEIGAPQMPERIWANYCNPRHPRGPAAGGIICRTEGDNLPPGRNEAEYIRIDGPLVDLVEAAYKAAVPHVGMREAEDAWQAAGNIRALTLADTLALMERAKEEARREERNRLLETLRVLVDPEAGETDRRLAMQDARAAIRAPDTQEGEG